MSELLVKMMTQQSELMKENLKKMKEIAKQIRRENKVKSSSMSSSGGGGGGGSEEKKKRKAKDPNHVKRAQTAYNLFFAEKSAEMKERNPQAIQKDLMGVVGPQWKALSAEERLPYETKAASLKSEHDKQVLAQGGVVKPSSTTSSSSSSSLEL